MDAQHALLGISSLQTRTAILGVVVSLVAFVAATAVYRVCFHPLSVFPGPKRFAITAVPQKWENHINGTWVRRIRGLHHQYGPIVRIGPDHLSIDGSIAWPQVYSHQAGKVEFGKLPGHFGIKNDQLLVGAPRDTHRRQRRHLGHAFSETALTEQQGIMLHYVDLLLDKLSEHARQEKKVNVVNWFNFMAFDIIGDLTFGEPFGSLTSSDYHPWIRTLIEGVRGAAMARFTLFYPILAPVFPILVGRKFLRANKEADELSETKAEARIAQGEVDGRRDFMSYMTRKNRNGEHGMTHEEQIINAPLLIGAGSETTASALSGFFFLMGNRQDLVRLLTEEVRNAFQTEKEITSKSAARLPFLSACLSEAMRLYPPAVETPPRVSPGADVEGKFVPEGTLISVYQLSTYRNPDHFADSEEFHPERWLPPTHALYNPKYAGDNRDVFKPFSVGPRDCVGKNLARAEMTVVASRILHRFDWELEPGQEDWIEKQRIFLIWEKPPLLVRFRHREETRGKLVDDQ